MSGCVREKDCFCFVYAKVGKLFCFQNFHCNLWIWTLLKYVIDNLIYVAGLLTVTVGKETVSNVAENSKSPALSKSDDVVLLEIDVKEPGKRSPVSASAVYGASPSQYIIRHGDDAQEVCIVFYSYIFLTTEQNFNISL